MTVVHKSMDLDEAFKLYRDKAGQAIRLTEPSNGQPIGSTWRINAVNKLGNSVVVSASPISGKGRGFFFPVTVIELLPAEVEETSEPMEFETPARNEFVFLPGMDEASPLADIFRRAAPNGETAQNLYMSYANEYSEYDIELMTDLLNTLDASHGTWWSPMTVNNLQAMLDRAQTIEVTEIPVVEPPVETPVQEEDVVPEVTIEQEVAAAPRKRGRPPGSKNKPKTLYEQVMAEEQQYTDTARHARPEPQWQDEVKPGTISNGFATMSIGEFQKKFSVIDVPDVNLQADETFETVYTDLQDKHFQKELHILVGQMLEYLNNTATDPQALLREAVKLVSKLV